MIVYKHNLYVRRNVIDQMKKCSNIEQTGHYTTLCRFFLTLYRYQTIKTLNTNNLQVGNLTISLSLLQITEFQLCLYFLVMIMTTSKFRKIYKKLYTGQFLLCCYIVAFGLLR